MFSIIAIIGKNRELGHQGQLIFHIPEDMQFFKETTLGHKVLMGRKTWESLPGKLPGRQNLVASHKAVPGADATITNLSQFIKDHQDTDEEIFVIGGGTIYQALLPYAKHLYLTEVDTEVPDADTFFPEFNRDKYNQELLKKGDQWKIKFLTLSNKKNSGN